MINSPAFIEVSSVSPNLFKSSVSLKNIRVQRSSFQAILRARNGESDAFLTRQSDVFNITVSEVFIT